eukprot:6432456-Alexandrium_andersonii.AAC.1
MLRPLLGPRSSRSERLKQFCISKGCSPQRDALPPAPHFSTEAKRLAAKAGRYSVRSLQSPSCS